MTVLTAAIVRSTEHNEIVDVDLSDLLTNEQTAEHNTAANEWDLQAFRDYRRDLVSAIIMEADAGMSDTDSVENGAVWEMWGTDDEGEDYRVHIRLDR